MPKRSAKALVRRIWLLNDLEAMAFAVPVLDSETHVLQQGMPSRAATRR